MRSICLSILCMGLVLFSTQLQAQRALYKPQVHQIGIQLGAINQIPSLSNQYTSAVPLSVNLANGIRYTYHYSISDGFRAGLFMRNGDFSYPEGVDRFDTYDAKKRDFDIHLGYIRKYHSRAHQVFAGADLIYSFGKIEENGMLSQQNYSGNYSYANYGASLLAGYSYFFSKHISMSFELEGYYTKTQHGRSILPDPGQFYILPTQELGFTSSISLSYHFVKMKKRCTCPKF